VPPGRLAARLGAGAPPGAGVRWEEDVVMRVLILLAALVAPSLVSASTPRLANGDAPALPVDMLGGGQVILEVTVDDAGTPADVKVLRDTPPFTGLLRKAVLGWKFEPRAPGTVLVAGVYAPPTLYLPAPGTPPSDAGSPSASIPFPTTIVPETYPPTARAGGGSVLVEVQVDAEGAVSSAAVVRSAPAFDGTALEAARRWRFRPARSDGAPAASSAYLVFGFPEPVVPPPAKH
jgi:TonB family protein